MDLVVDSELLQPNQAVKTVFVHCTWYRRCLWTPHIIFNQIHDVEFLALFEHFAWFPNNVRRSSGEARRNTAEVPPPTPPPRRCRHQRHRRRGSLLFSCIQIRLLHEQAALHGVQFGPVKLGQLLFVCLWRLDMAMVIFKLW